MDRLHHIEEIFQEALQRDPGLREAFVRNACRGDDELRREVSSLLLNHDEADGEPWAAAAAARLMAGQRSLEAGRSLGPYRIERFVAAGGMGEVYRPATRAWIGLSRSRSFPPRSPSDAQFRERFDREARAISQLDHPHICTLYDVGEQDGSSFLVMQYLEGETLAHRLKEGALPLEQALQYRDRRSPTRSPRRIAPASSIAISNPATSC